jgi:threonylcarbamoyladenosine tRNA methylthiotransferase MtaB
VVSGCAVSLPGPPPAIVAAADLVVPNADKDRLVAIAVDRLGLAPGPVAVPGPDPGTGGETLFARSRQRAFVKVQDGCRHRCAYCVITLARGDERSRPIQELVSQVQGLVDAGVEEVVLTGVHLGGYGTEPSEQGLTGLVRALLDQTGIRRLRLGSLEPWDLAPGFWGLFADPRLMPHLHLPIQSGSRAVLRRMTRRGGPRQFLDLAAAARRAVPDINLTTDIIAGFPGETEAEWGETLAMVREIGFGDIHAFPYSPRPGTRAAELPGQVPAEVRQARTLALRRLAIGLRRAALGRLIGKRVEVLVEGREPVVGWLNGRLGYSPGYHPVRLYGEAGLDRPGRIRLVRLTGLDGKGEALEGTLEPEAGQG